MIITCITAAKICSAIVKTESCQVQERLGERIYGKEARENVIELLSVADKEKLCESGQLRDYSPKAVWFYITMHFSWTG